MECIGLDIEVVGIIKVNSKCKHFIVPSHSLQSKISTHLLQRCHAGQAARVFEIEGVAKARPGIPNKGAQTYYEVQLHNQYRFIIS